MEYITSFEGWKIYRKISGWFIARKGRKWTESHYTLDFMEKAILSIIHKS